MSSAAKTRGVLTLWLLTVWPLGTWAPPALAEVGPSPLIYPVPQPTLRFSHQKHSTQPCQRCHSGILSSSSPQERALPRETVCARCHNQVRPPDWRPASVAMPANASQGCSYCHTGFSGEGVPRAFLYPAAKLRFGHRLHLDKGTLCRDCHRLDQPGRPMPKMSSCLACHQRQRASTRCVVCHLSEKDGRLSTKFGTARLVPSGSLRGDRHDALFARNHAAVARLNRSYCESCHQPSSCLRCHAGTMRPMAIHPNDYASLHAVDARRDQTRCRACHSLQTYCVGCHQRTGVGVESRRSGFRPDTARSFHPAGFSALQIGPAHHAYAARRNGNTCLSCHREDTCIRCHGSTGRGLGGFSPHPPGFASSAKCRALAGRNSRACVKCHLPGDARAVCR